DGGRGVRPRRRGDPQHLRRGRAGPSLSGLIEQIQAAGRALVLGIGGGGDVVGALAVARLCESLGTPFTLGGIAWERLPIDPHPGPRPLAQIQGGRRLGEAAVLAGPRTATPEGVAFSEAHMAAHLGTETL